MFPNIRCSGRQQSPFFPKRKPIIHFYLSVQFFQVTFILFYLFISKLFEKKKLVLLNDKIQGRVMAVAPRCPFDHKSKNTNRGNQTCFLKYYIAHCAQQNNDAIFITSKDFVAEQFTLLVIFFLNLR